MAKAIQQLTISYNILGHKKIQQLIEERKFSSTVELLLKERFPELTYKENLEQLPKVSEYDF